MIEEEPLCPSLVAVTVALPAPTAVTRPVVLTVAAAVLLETQVTIRPLRTVPFPSLVTTVNCCVCVIPTTRLTVEGVTVTVATGAGVTVRGALPTCPSLVAVMLAVPALTAVTRPVVGETVATAVLSELQVIVRPVSARLWASSRVAVPCVV